ncbi:MAG: tetratricopeptide repeat protein [Ignavibacteriae bacterium]|nr:tetratricopeptide repeat protein [Ignavibacteriota bacterium]NOG98515.1 tetratricopeptide repeat protein [Ignavibacteriota bacterium]
MKSKLVVFVLLMLFANYSANTILSDKKLIAFQSSISAESSGNYDSAIKFLEDIYKDFSDDYLINLRLGWLNYVKKDYDKSVKYYNKAIKICDNCTEALLGLTYPLAAQNKWSDVESIYQKILEKDENNYAANLNLGKIKYNEAAYLNAKIYLEKIYENFPSDVETNIYLGWTYYQLGNASKANHHFTDALINDPDNSSALEGINLTR